MSLYYRPPYHPTKAGKMLLPPLELGCSNNYTHLALHVKCTGGLSGGVQFRFFWGGCVPHFASYATEHDKIPQDWA